MTRTFFGNTEAEKVIKVIRLDMGTVFVALEHKFTRRLDDEVRNSAPGGIPTDGYSMKWCVETIICKAVGEGKQSEKLDYIIASDQNKT